MNQLISRYSYYRNKLDRTWIQRFNLSYFKLINFQLFCLVWYSDLKLISFSFWNRYLRILIFQISIKCQTIAHLYVNCWVSGSIDLQYKVAWQVAGCNGFCSVLWRLVLYAIILHFMFPELAITTKCCSYALELLQYYVVTLLNSPRNCGNSE